MKSEISFNQLLKDCKIPKVYMMIGNGSKNQFRYMSKVKKIMDKILKDIPKNSIFIYFGDPPNPKKPDIGMCYKYLSEKRSDIKIYMIQISKAKSWGYPDFVYKVYWHNDFTKKHMWGGLDNKKNPCSNTKKWVNLHKKIKCIDKIFVFGGGKITLEELMLAKKHNIDYNYFAIERKFKGDGKTRVTNKDSKKDRIGITYSLK